MEHYRAPIPVTVGIIFVVGGVAFLLGLAANVWMFAIPLALGAALVAWVMFEELDESRPPPHMAPVAKSAPQSSSSAARPQLHHADGQTPETGSVGSVASSSETSRIDVIATTPIIPQASATTPRDRSAQRPAVETKHGAKAPLAHEPEPGTTVPTFGDPSRGTVERKPSAALELHQSGYVMPAGTMSDSFTLERHEIRAASRIGLSHAYRNEPRQDHYLVTSAADGEYVVAIIADGLGSAPNSHFGSYWTVRLLARELDVGLRENETKIDVMIQRTKNALLDRMRSDLGPNTDPTSIVTTVVVLVIPSAGGRASVYRIGDSDALQFDGQSWQSLFGTEESGALAGAATDAFPATCTVEGRHVQIDSGCVMLATDGVSDPVLKSTDHVGVGFAKWLAAPIHEIDFLRLLAFDRRAATDDRTAIAIWNR